jgi:hypothetical protein
MCPCFVQEHTAQKIQKEISQDKKEREKRMWHGSENKHKEKIDYLPSWPRRSCGYRPSKPTEYLLGEKKVSGESVEKAEIKDG